MSEVAVAAPEKSARWEDLLDVFIAPVELFRRRADESWTKPFLLLVAVGVVLYYAFLSANTAIWEAAMTQDVPEGLDPAQAAQAAQFMKWIGGIFVPFTFLFLIALTAAGLKLASAILEPAATWRQSFTIATFAAYVAIPQQIVTALIVTIKGRSSEITMQDASFGLLRFLDPTNVDPALNALLSRVDIFPLWGAALCAVGLMVVVGMPRGKAIGTAAAAWLLLAVPGVVGGLISGV